MKFAGRIVEIHYKGDHTLLVAQSGGVRAHIPVTNELGARAALGDKIELSANGPPDAYTLMPPRTLQ